MSSKTLPKPLYAVAGAGDFLARKLQEAGPKLQEAGPKLQEKAAALPGKAQRLADELPLQVKKFTSQFPEGLRKFAADLPSYAGQLRQTVQTKAQQTDMDTIQKKARVAGQKFSENFKAATGKALNTYEELAARGAQLVGNSRQESTPATTPASNLQAVVTKEITKTKAEKAPAKPKTKPQIAPSSNGTKPAKTKPTESRANRKPEANGSSRKA